MAAKVSGVSLLATLAMGSSPSPPVGICEEFLQNTAVCTCDQVDPIENLQINLHCQVAIPKAPWISSPSPPTTVGFKLDADLCSSTNPKLILSIIEPAQFAAPSPTYTQIVSCMAGTDACNTVYPITSEILKYLSYFNITVPQEQLFSEYARLDAVVGVNGNVRSLSVQAGIQYMGFAGAVVYFINAENIDVYKYVDWCGGVPANGLSAGAVAGITIGTVFGAVILAVLIYCLCKKFFRQPKEGQPAKPKDGSRRNQDTVKLNQGRENSEGREMSAPESAAASAI